VVIIFSESDLSIGHSVITDHGTYFTKYMDLCCRLSDTFVCSTWECFSTSGIFFTLIYYEGSRLSNFHVTNSFIVALELCAFLIHSVMLKPSLTHIRWDSSLFSTDKHWVWIQWIHEYMRSLIPFNSSDASSNWTLSLATQECLSDDSSEGRVVSFPSFLHILTSESWLFCKPMKPYYVLHTSKTSLLCHYSWTFLRLPPPSIK